MSDSEQVIDVERLVEELKERVERQRAAGGYADDLAVAAPLHVGTPPSPAAWNGGPGPAPRVVFLPGDRYRSPRRIVGAVISLFRRIVLRLVHPALDDIARQTDTAVTALHRRTEWAAEAIEAEARAREDVERRIGGLSRLEADVGDSLAGMRESQDDLRHRHGERLERLETTARAFQTSSVATIAGLTEHLRALDDRAVQIAENLTAVSTEASALARHVEGLEGSAGDELSAVRKHLGSFDEHLRSLAEQLRDVAGSTQAVTEQLTPFDPPGGYLLTEAGGRAVIGFRREDPRPAGDDLYRRFEDVFRQDEATIRERQRVYVDLVRGAEPVLDVGCGRGEFLELLREAGVEGRGVDLDRGMVARCAEKGLDVEEADALSYLESLQDGSIGTIFSAQVIEHLSYADLGRLLELAHAKLASGGQLIAETVNPHSLVALRAFWLDPTHRAPIYPETALVLAELHGFASGEVVFPRGSGKLEVDRAEQPDYAVVAKKA